MRITCLAHKVRFAQFKFCVALTLVSSFQNCWSNTADSDVASLYESFNQTYSPTPTITEQIRSTLLSVLLETGLIPPSALTTPPLADDPFPQEPLAAPQRALGLTDADVDTGGSVKQRLEDQTRTIESNGCKLCHLISSFDFMQREARKNMNILMEEMEIIKKEQLYLKGLLLAHDVNVLKIIDSNGVSNANFIEDAQTLAGTIQRILPQIASTEFVPYDIEEIVHHCIHNERYYHNKQEGEVDEQ